ncbi:MAG: hypothetical protein JXX28_04150 [Deltaproteobacteria bacterium]|nr:hypothetical protein [Deltaproteobacteria bacterium]
MRWTSSLLPLALLGACSQDYGYQEHLRTDVFRQNLERAVDLLIVIDNSGSMIEEQESLARNFDALIASFEAANVSWQIGVATTDVDGPTRGLLVGGDDEVVLRGPSGELDRVVWDRSWGFQAGVALQLDPEHASTADNDHLENWCPATAVLGDELLGTPGQANPTCQGVAVERPAPGEDLGPRAPRVGELLITELMPLSAGEDRRCEWLELSNLSDDTLSLDGVSLSDLGRDYFVLPEGLSVAPWGAIAVGREAGSSCGYEIPVGAGEALVLHDDVRVITAATADARDRFVENVAQGINGGGIEMGLEGARLVFEEPTWSESNAETGFLRDDALFAVLFVSDEDDLSPWPVDAYARYFMGLKGDLGYRDPHSVRLSAVVGIEPPPRDDLPSCESESGVAWYGRRYLEAAALTDGAVESICEEDFAAIAERLSLTFTELQLDFSLSSWPKPGTLVVSLYESEDDDGLIRELVLGEDYTYVADGNKLHFDEAHLPPAGQFVVAKYTEAAVEVAL